MDKVNLAESFTRTQEHWQHRVVADLNGQEVKLVKIQGTFSWHLREAAVLVFEPKGVLNTGNFVDATLTAPLQQRL